MADDDVIELGGDGTFDLSVAPPAPRPVPPKTNVPSPSPPPATPSPSTPSQLLGNTSFKATDYIAALKHYTTALSDDAPPPFTRAQIHSNRSLTTMKLHYPTFPTSVSIQNLTTYKAAIKGDSGLRGALQLAEEDGKQAVKILGMLPSDVAVKGTFYTGLGIA